MKFSKIALFCKWLRKKLHKIEFSKVLCGLVAVGIGGVAIYAIARYYSLCSMAIKYGSGIQPDVALAVTCVGTLLGAVLSYCLYQFGLKNSRNKYGIDTNGEPYKQKIADFLNEIQNENNENGGNEQ